MNLLMWGLITARLNFTNNLNYVLIYVNFLSSMSAIETWNVTSFACRVYRSLTQKYTNSHTHTHTHEQQEGTLLARCFN